MITPHASLRRPIVFLLEFRGWEMHGTSIHLRSNDHSQYKQQYGRTLLVKILYTERGKAASQNPKKVVSEGKTSMLVFLSQ